MGLLSFRRSWRWYGSVPKKLTTELLLKPVNNFWSLIHTFSYTEHHNQVCDQFHNYWPTAKSEPCPTMTLTSVEYWTSRFVPLYLLQLTEVSFSAIFLLYPLSTVTYKVGILSLVSHWRFLIHRSHPLPYYVLPAHVHAKSHFRDLTHCLLVSEESNSYHHPSSQMSIFLIHIPNISTYISCSRPDEPASAHLLYIFSSLKAEALGRLVTNHYYSFI